MPYPKQVTYDSIIETAHALIETEGGADKLSLKRLAGELGIKAPSLYNHVRNKEALIRGVNMLTEAHLYQSMQDVLAETAADSVSGQLLAIARGFRAYAHNHPVTYMLLFSTRSDDQRPDPVDAQGNILALQAMMSEIAGEADSLSALRGMLALLHGFAMLELNDQLRRGGDLSEAFEKSVAAYLRGWEKTS